MAKQAQKGKPQPQATSEAPETLSGKRVVVSGGTTGIGKATARLLASRGARLLVFGRTEDEARAAEREMAAVGEFHALAADQSRIDEVRRVFREVDSRLGGVDFMINNAAVAPGSTLDGTLEDFEYGINTNVLGYVACTREAVERMRRNPGPIKGHVVNVGSMSADFREEGNDVYVATKAAVQGLSESIRKQLNKEGIKLSLIEPGLVGTPLSEVSREEQRRKEREMTILKPEDIAGAVEFCLTQPQRCDVVVMQIRPLMQRI